MTYLLIALLIVIISSIRSLAFAFYLFKIKNFTGGIMVSLLSISAIALMIMQI